MNSSNLFSASGCIGKEALELYRTNRLSNHQKQRLKDHAKKCPICADALQGVRLVDRSVVSISQGIKARYYKTHPGSKPQVYQSPIVRLIGTLFLLAGLVFMFWVMNNSSFNRFNINPSEKSTHDTSVTDTLR